MAVNTMDYNSKDLMLDVVRTERAKFFNIVDDPKNWKVQTRASEWKVQDMVGHMIDVTEGYLERWDMARKGEPAGSLGLQVMGDTLNKNAQALRRLPREEAIARLKADSDNCHPLLHGSTAHTLLSCFPCHGLRCSHLGYALGAGR